MDFPKSKVYCMVDDKNRISRIEGGYTMGNISDLSQWVYLDEGYGDRYNLCQSNYLDSPLYTEDGIPRWKLAEGKATLRSEAEIDADRDARPKPVAPPTVEGLAEENRKLASQLQASIESNAMLEDCLAEMAEIVYA